MLLVSPKVYLLGCFPNSLLLQKDQIRLVVRSMPGPNYARVDSNEMTPEEGYQGSEYMLTTSFRSLFF